VTVLDIIENFQCDVIRIAEAFDAGRLTEVDQKIIRFALQIVCSRRANTHAVATAVAILKLVVPPTAP
jgi:hypothetical protein